MDEPNKRNIQPDSLVTLTDMSTLQREFGPELSRMTLQGKIKGDNVLIEQVKEQQTERARKRTLRQKIEIGRGGMGVVYSTEQASLKRIVGAKKLYLEAKSALMYAREYHPDKIKSIIEELNNLGESINKIPLPK